MFTARAEGGGWWGGGGGGGNEEGGEGGRSRESYLQLISDTLFIALLPSC